MFDQSSHDQPLTPSGTPSATSNIPSPTAPSAPTPSTNDGSFSHLSTMPEQFYAPPKKKPRWGIIVMTVAVVLLLIAGMILFNKMVNTSPEQSAFDFFRKKPVASTSSTSSATPASSTSSGTDTSTATAPSLPSASSTASTPSAQPGSSGDAGNNAGSFAVPGAGNAPSPSSSSQTTGTGLNTNIQSPQQEGFTPPPASPGTSQSGATNPAPQKVQSSQDQDGDGLTDEEEKTYGSDPTKADTDGDGYTDGQEVMNGYSPTDKEGGKTLLDDKKVSVYTNQTYRYSFWYPNGWLAQPTDSSGQEVLVTAPTGEFVSIQVQPNSANDTAAQWYAKANPLVSAQQLDSFQTTKGLKGVTSPDGLTHYIRSRDGKWIIVLAYNIGLRDKANFLSTVVMMRNSLVFNP